MSLRILGGLAKGTNLKGPPGPSVRPTAVLLKRRIFDSFQDLTGNTFLDLCAGIGGMGIEAWSRGASEVIMVEKDHKTFKALQGNCNLIQSRFEREIQSRRLKTVKKDVVKWIQYFKDEYSSWDQSTRESTILFLDPPYEAHQVYDQIMVKEFAQSDWFEGEFWVESDTKKGPPLSLFETSPLKIRKQFSQGDNFLLILEKTL